MTSTDIHSPNAQLIVEEGPQSLSVVIPFYNEAGNILPLLREVHSSLEEYDGPWEIIAVDDGSRDGTATELDAARKELGPHIHVIHFARNFGQTAAMQTGIQAANGGLLSVVVCGRSLHADRSRHRADVLR